MTGKLRISREYHPACYRRLRLSKRPHLSSTASCLEYVRVGSIRFFVLIPFYFYFQFVTDTTSMTNSI